MGGKEAVYPERRECREYSVLRSYVIWQLQDCRIAEHRSYQRIVHTLLNIDQSYHTQHLYKSQFNTIQGTIQYYNNVGRCSTYPTRYTLD